MRSKQTSRGRVVAVLAGDDKTMLAASLSTLCRSAQASDSPPAQAPLSADGFRFLLQTRCPACTASGDHRSSVGLHSEHEVSLHMA